MIVVTAQQIAAAAKIGLAITLVGVDGSTWDLVNGPVRLRTGVAGLGTPDPERWWQDSPALDGSIHLGYRIPRGRVILPIRITDDSSLGWRDTQAAFARALDPSGQCFLQISASDSSARTVGMRYASGWGDAYQFDPLLIAHASYTLELDVEYPYWSGVAVSYTWTGTSQIPTSVTTGKPVTNPGEIPVLGRWTLGGPWTTAWVGPDQASLVKLTGHVGLSVGIPAGDGRIVETDPRATPPQGIYGLDGSDQWGDVTSRAFAPIPAGDTTVRILATAATSVTSFALDFTAAHRQPW